MDPSPVDCLQLPSISVGIGAVQRCRMHWTSGVLSVHFVKYPYPIPKTVLDILDLYFPNHTYMVSFYCISKKTENLLQCCE